MRLAHELEADELKQHEYWMGEALALAQEAAALGEVPIGAVIVKDGELLAQAYNLRESDKKATAHAELLAIERANSQLDAWRLEGATLYVTIEPCAMCAGTIINARIQQVVYGAQDPKAGCAGSLMNLLEEERFNHQVDLIQGVCEDACAEAMRNFFKALRTRNRKQKLDATDLSTD